MSKKIMLLLIVLSCCGFAYAQMNEDSILVVPKTTIAPVIDGQLDSLLWNRVGETPVNRGDTGDVAPPDDEWDLDGRLRMQWDDDNLYIWLYVQDESINTGTDYNTDGVEMYFDADNAKTDGFDGIDDIQMRFNVGEATTDEIDITSTGWTYDKSTVNYIIAESNVGWNLEVALPLGDLQLIPGQEFGFDAQINDNDNGSSRENMYRWWATNNNMWNHANLWGTAYLDEKGIQAIDEKSTTMVRSFDLAQNYPNPFNPTTTIDYSVSEKSNVAISVYDMLGKKVATLVDEIKSPGQYTATFNGMAYADGIYYYTLTTGNRKLTKKMALIK